MLDLLLGYRRAGAVVNLAAPGGNANGAAIMTLSTSASMVGTKTLVIRRLKIRSNAVGADTWVHIGTGVVGAIVDVMPALRLVNNTTDDYEEDDLPSVEVVTNLMAYVDAIAVGSVDIQVEVEERG